MKAFYKHILPRLPLWLTNTLPLPAMYIDPNDRRYTLRALYWESIEDLTVCALCHGYAREVFCGDEGWTVCADCQSVEQGYLHIHESEE